MAIDFAARQRWTIAVLAAPDLSPIDKIVAVRLSLFLNTETGRCFPAKSTLADATQLSKRTVDRALVVLAALGWVVIEASEGRRANSYGLRFPRAVAVLNPVTRDTVEASNHVSADTPTLSAVTPQQRIEHKTSSLGGSARLSWQQGLSGSRAVAKSDPTWPLYVEAKRRRNARWCAPAQLVDVGNGPEPGWYFEADLLSPPRRDLALVGGSDPPLAAKG